MQYLHFRPSLNPFRCCIIAEVKWHDSKENFTILLQLLSKLAKAIALPSPRGLKLRFNSCNLPNGPYKL